MGSEVHMIKIIFGNQGVGKSRQLCRLANDRLATARGSIVFIDKDCDHMYDLNRQIRFINASDYRIDGPKMFSGFLSGIAAQDFDLEAVYINSFVKIIKHPIDSLRGMFAFLNDFSARTGVEVVISVSAGGEPLPDFMEEYVIR